MSSPATARLACASPAFVAQAPATTLDDWLSYVAPDVAVLTGSTPAPRARSTLRRRLDGDTILYHPGSNSPERGPRTIAGVQFVFAPTTTELEELAEYEQSHLDTDEPTFVLGGLLELDVDTTALSTSLVGWEAYVDALDADKLDGEYRHVSTQLPASYRRDWDGLTVLGGGAEAGTAGTPLAALDCRADGRVLTRTLRRSRLGLRALDGVGGTRARRLRDAGFETREAVADAAVRTLADVQGIGRPTAGRIRHSARAIADGEVVRRSDDPLPVDDPLYIDIETDGLAPTITWLIGVLDGTAAEGEYRSFVQRDPDDPGGAVAAFMSWYTAHASDRPLVAYRGRKFDFDVLYDHIVEYCPRYEDAWADARRFDPYEWAIEDGNAILPGRTNALEDVAGALGYERAETGLTGAAVARSYQQWMADRSPVTEPDWERFDAYCEDDVRALATVYEALADSGRLVSTGEPSRNVSETTTQGTLSDW